MLPQALAKASGKATDNSRREPDRIRLALGVRHRPQNFMEGVVKPRRLLPLIALLSLVAMQTPAAPNRKGHSKLRVFIDDGGRVGALVEAINAIRQQCPRIRVCNKKGKADYILALEVETFDNISDPLEKFRTSVAVFDRKGDLVYSDQDSVTRDAIRKACKAIKKDAKKQ